MDLDRRLSALRAVLLVTGVAFVLGVAGEALRQAGARQRIEHGQPVALEARVIAFPEWRGTGQRQ